jgi:hypothetical protein
MGKVSSCVTTLWVPVLVTVEINRAERLREANGYLPGHDIFRLLISGLFRVYR